MASQLKVDTLTGVTTAGSIDVTGEGNSTTTNLQQGLAKCWANVAGQSDPASLRDSFNISSLTDVGGGNYGLNFSNNMSNDDYGGGIGGQDTGTRDNVHLSFESQSTSDYRIQYYEGSSLTDCVRILTIIAGDLA